MRISRYIINNLLFFELCTSTVKQEIKVWRVSNKGKKVFLVEQKFDIEEEPKKWKYFPAVLLITGDQVISKKFRKDDLSFNRITENPELLWDLSFQSDSEEQTVSFLRKELIEELIGVLERSEIYVLKKWIIKEEDISKEKLIVNFYKNHFRLVDIRNNLPQINMLSLIIYYKMRLPVLLLFFMMVLGNFLFNIHLRQEYETAQSELYFNQRNNKQQQDTQKKQAHILSLYQSLPNRSIALIADRIASYVPQKLVLNSLLFFPLEGTEYNSVQQNKKIKFKENFILIEGETEIPGGVSLFTQFLEKDQLFSNVKIVSLVKDKDSSIFTFELNIELKP